MIVRDEPYGLFQHSIHAAQGRKRDSPVLCQAMEDAASRHTAFTASTYVYHQAGLIGLKSVAYLSLPHSLC